MNTIKKFIANHKISLKVFWITLVIFLALYAIDKYSNIINNSIFLFSVYMLSMTISVLFFTFIFLHSTFKYTGWSSVTGILGATIACIYLHEIILLGAFMGSIFGVLLFSIPAILGGYFFGALIAVLSKVICLYFKKS